MIIMKELPGGEKLAITVYSRPINRSDQMSIIELLQLEWERTDIDWLESMRGAYSETLSILTAVGMLDGKPAGMASIAFAVDTPEVCVVENVMTREPCRRLGIASCLVRTLMELAREKECRLFFLGNAYRSRSVYEQIGFTRIAGAILRHAAPDWEDYETVLYRPGQKVSIRNTVWGDLPGVVALAAQPSRTMLLDYLRGLVSATYNPVRCVSNFTTVKYGTQISAGSMTSFIGENPYRVLGFGSLTPGPSPLREKTAIIDVALHDNYAGTAPQFIRNLVENARQKGIDTVEAYLASGDTGKKAWFENEGFRQTAVLPRQVCIEGDFADVSLMHRRL